MSDVKPSTPELIETLKHEFEAVKAPSDGYFFPGKIAGVPVLVHRKFVFAGVMWAVFTLIFVDTPWLKTFPQFMPAIIQVLIATLGMAFIVIVHEAGHFFAAWWLRVPIRATVFMPNGGMVITEPMRSGFWRRITVLSAGVLAQAILFVAAQLLLPKLQFSDLIMQPLYFTFIAGNLLFAIGNL